MPTRRRKEGERCFGDSTRKLRSDATQKTLLMAVETSTRQLTPATVAKAQKRWKKGIWDDDAAVSAF